jgi:hypothetical protein
MPGYMSTPGYCPGPVSEQCCTQLTCAQVDQAIGCCDAASVLHYCSSGAIMNEPCTGMHVCGWNAARNYYDCVPPPVTSSPMYPRACQ